MQEQRFVSILGLAALALASLTLPGCNNSSSNSSTPQPISLSVSASKTAIDQGQTSSVTATVVNDTSNTGVKWTVSCSASSCGSVSPTSTASGAATTYTAPANPSSATITATSVADSTKTATATITVNAPPALTPPAGGALPSASVGVAYSFNLSSLLSGGTSPFTWSLTGGTLPAGLSLAANGTISGTPTTAAVAAAQHSPSVASQTQAPTCGSAVSLTFTVQDSGNPAMSASVTVKLTVCPAALTITTTALANGAVGVAYGPGGAGVTVMATGGITPYTWTWAAQSGSSLPAGLTIGAASGAISGTPTKAGTFNVTVTVTDSVSNTAQANFTVTISAAAALAIQTTSLPNGTTNAAYTTKLSATGGVSPYTWSWAAQSGSSLPVGLNIATNADGTGTISGTPTGSGIFNVTVTVTDSASNSAHVNFSLTITQSAACTASHTTLCGQFAFLVQGFDSAGAYTVAGSFITDGKNILSGGVLDLNSFDRTATDVSITAGSPSAVSVGSDGRGTLTLATSNSAIGDLTFSFALNSNGSFADMIEFDDTSTTGTGRHATGFLQAQDVSAFNASAVAGNYAFAFLGGNSTGARYAMVGLATASGSGCGINSNGGTTTVNEGGTITSSASFTCSGAAGLPSLNSLTGRGTVPLSYSFAIALSPTLNYSFYVVSASKLIFIATDTQGAGSALFSGVMQRQVNHSTGFTSADLACGGSGAADTGCIFATSGSAGGGTTAHVSVGRIVQVSAGSYTVTIDDNKAGVFASGTVAGGTGTIGSGGNGHASFPNLKLVDVVLTDTDTGFTLTENGGVDFGILRPQTSETFTATPGTFILASAYIGNTRVPNASGILTPTAPGGGGAGTFTGTLDVEQVFSPPVLIAGAAVSGAYTLDATTGRATGSSTSPGPSPLVLWIVSSNSFVLIEIDSTNVDPVLLIFSQ